MQRRIRYTLLFTCIAFFCGAQSFRFTQYTTHNGLPIDNVYAAAQDSSGYLWFATDFGISKFDGYRFTNYYKNNGMANKAVTDIVYAGGDSLVFLSYPNKIQSIKNNGSIKTLASCNSFSLQQICKHNNSYFVYQREQGRVGLLQNGRCLILPLDSLFKRQGLLLHSVFTISKTTVAFCTNKGLFLLWDNGSQQVLLEGQDVAAGIANAGNSVTAVCNNTITTLNLKTGAAVTASALPASIFVYHMIRDNEGAVWLRGIDKGIYRFFNNQLEEMSGALQLPNKIVHEFFVDGTGNTWFCTDGAGVLLKKANAFKVFETADGLCNNRVQQLLLHSGELFVGTSNGLCVKNNEGIKTVALPSSGRGLKWVFALCSLNDKSIGIAADAVFTFSQTKPESLVQKQRAGGYLFTAFNGFNGLQQTDSVYWLGGKGFIARIGTNAAVKSWPLQQVKARKLYSLLFYQNKLWAGTDNGIAFIENEKLYGVDSVNGIRLGQVFQFLVAANGLLWMATENGLFYYDGKWNQVPSGSTYGSNYCTAITADKAGNIWCATWDGFFITSGDARINFNTADGLPSKTCNAILYDSSRQSVYIGTDNGLALVECNKLNGPQQFQKVFITCNRADSAMVADGTVLESFNNNLHFYFNLPFYGSTNETEYEYRLDNGKWQSASTPDIFLSDISSKDHRLEVRARINGMPVTRSNALFSFSIKQRFYKSWWFWLLVLGVAQFVVYRLISRYYKQKRRKQLLLQQQQNELASLKQQAFTSLMNPHFIFNALNSIQFYINKQDRQTANKYLSDFATLVRRSFDAAQKPYVTLDEELETIRLYLQLEKMRFTDKFDYSITLNEAAEEEEWLLPGMVLQPFLENAILHGLAPLSSHGLITIDIKGADNMLYITITDNGIGIQKSKQLQTAKKHSSRGMQLIRERLEILSSNKSNPVKLSITDYHPGTDRPGTKIELLIPQEIYQNTMQ